MARAFIFGAGGHSYVIASFLDAEPCFLVRDAPSSDDQMTEAEFFHRIDQFRQSPIYIGIGNNAVRRRIFDQLAAADVTLPVCVAPNAWVARDAYLSPGAVICAGAVIGARAHIGANTIVNTLSSVDHDCVIGDDTQITVGVTLAGTVKVGKSCFFGLKSAVVPNRTIGDNVSVMAGSLIVRDVESSVLVGGSPARVMRVL